MKIANPIYDVVFKYLMDDSKVATIILSALTGLEIIDLEFYPQELVTQITNEEENKENPLLNLGIYRLDFKAKVKTKSGERLIIVEIQKSKIFATPMRFRTYLGHQLTKKEYYLPVKVGGKFFKAGLPIISIYLLGELINPAFAQIPMIKISKKITDAYTGNQLIVDDFFINSLYHEGIIVNIPALKQKRRDDIEKLLSIFDQDNIGSSTHIMNVKEVDFPLKYRPVIRRLQNAVQVGDIAEVMQREDDFQAELDAYFDAFQTERVLKEEALHGEQQALQMKAETEKLLSDAIELLLGAGMAEQEIAKKLQISETTLVELLKNQRKK